MSLLVAASFNWYIQFIYICEMIRQFDEIFCSTIRYIGQSRHTHLVTLTVRDLGRNKTVLANFNLLCEGQKWHNTGRKGHFREKRDKTRSFKTKGDNRDIWGLFPFQEILLRVKSREGRPHVVSDSTRSWLGKKQVMVRIWNWVCLQTLYQLLLFKILSLKEESFYLQSIHQLGLILLNIYYCHHF